jgi:hypothetical protein
MSPREKTSQRVTFTAGIVAAVLLVMGVYLGGYYALLDGKRLDGRYPIALGLQKIQFVPHYRAGGRAATVFFYPANACDRLLRRSYWNELRGWDELQVSP